MYNVYKKSIYKIQAWPHQVKKVYKPRTKKVTISRTLKNYMVNNYKRIP